MLLERLLLRRVKTKHSVYHRVKFMFLRVYFRAWCWLCKHQVLELHLAAGCDVMLLRPHMGDVGMPARALSE